MNLQCIALVLLLNYYPTYSTKCYQCNGYSHPSECAHVVKCASDQMCFTKSVYNLTTRSIVYESGCKSRTECEQHHTIIRTAFGKRQEPSCNFCCDSDFCNFELCDAHKNTNLGPRCLSCDTSSLLDPGDCLKITQCAKDEVLCHAIGKKHMTDSIQNCDGYGNMICYTQKLGSTYRMGCALEKYCLPKSPLVGRANIEGGHCGKCCDKSYCNSELCGNSPMVVGTFHVYPLNQVNFRVSDCRDTDYETCQHLLHTQSGTCNDPNTRALCKRSCDACDHSCEDLADFDCAVVSQHFNICGDYSNARQYCRKFCGYCQPTNGGWSVWSYWTPCSRTCNNGLQQRTRTCTNPKPTHGGDPCAGAAMETQECGNIDCPINGGWSAWSTWGDCTSPCGAQGIQERRRICSNPSPLYGGADCDGPVTEERICRLTQTDCRNIVRLANGTHSTGRVEIRIHGRWGTVCDDFFDEAAARSVCKTLGLPYGSAIQTSTRIFGSGTGPIWLDNVICNGTQTFPIGCSTNFIGVHNCSHDEDVGVICK